MLFPWQDHPRSRGVYRAGSSTANAFKGSSPLARGLRRGVSADGWTRGIIPARAGFTIVSLRLFVRFADHPRSRGVYSALKAALRMSRGSSPLARGLHGEGVAVVGDGRIIPARAGFTSTLNDRMIPTKDHPRSRGVYPPMYVYELKDLGSSPLARGLHRGVTRVGDRDRIIPARAGFTPGCGRPPPGGQDHPRSRGVY